MRTPSILLTDEVADRLLAGEHPAHPVGLVLSVATRPGTAHELTGEAAARQAFVASRTCSAGGSPQRGRHRLRTDRALFTAKAVGAAALALTAGGVAVAATGPSGGTLTPVADEPTDTVSAPSRPEAHAAGTAAADRPGAPVPVADVDCDPPTERPLRVTGAWIADLVRGEGRVGAGSCWPGRPDRSPSGAVALGATAPGDTAAAPSATTGPGGSRPWTGGTEGGSGSWTGAGGDAVPPATSPDPRPAVGPPGPGAGALDPDADGQGGGASRSPTGATPTPTSTPSAPPSSSPRSGSAEPSGASGASSGDPTTPSQPRDHRHGP